MTIKLCFVNIYTEHVFSEYTTMFVDLIFSVGTCNSVFQGFFYQHFVMVQSRSKLKNQVKSPFPWLNHG